MLPVYRDLTERGLWTPEVRNQIIADQGSIQSVREIPQELKDLYKTVWEIKQKAILNQVRVFVWSGRFRREQVGMYLVTVGATQVSNILDLIVLRFPFVPPLK